MVLRGRHYHRRIIGRITATHYQILYTRSGSVHPCYHSSSHHLSMVNIHIRCYSLIGAIDCKHMLPPPLRVQSIYPVLTPLTLVEYRKDAVPLHRSVPSFLYYGAYIWGRSRSITTSGLNAHCLPVPYVLVPYSHIDYIG